MGKLRQTLRALFPKIDARSFQWNGPPPNTYYSWGRPGYTGYHTPKEQTPNDWQTYVDLLYKSSPVVFMAAQARANLFSEIRFQWRPVKEVATQFNLHGTLELELLEKPWPGGTTKDLCKRALLDADAAGNFFARREVSLKGKKRLRRLRPDWVTIELNDAADKIVESDIDHYAYWPGGVDSGNDPVRIEIEDMVHWAPIPDPNSMFLGMSWLTPIINEVLAEKAATRHLLNFFKKGAQLGIIAMIREGVEMDYDDMVQAREEFFAGHVGEANAYEPMWAGPAYDFKVIQNDLKSLDLGSVRAHVEAHITGAAGVPAVMLGLAEGQSTSALGVSNYKPAAEGFVDRTMRDLWHSFCDALEPVVGEPHDKEGVVIRGQRLWYSDADISVLNRDRKEDADIMSSNLTAIMAATTQGATFESAKLAVQSGDIKKLKHTGDRSVQLQQESEVNKTKLEAIAIAIKAGATQESAVLAVEADDLSKLVFEAPPEEETPEEEEPSTEEEPPDDTQNEEGELWQTLTKTLRPQSPRNVLCLLPSRCTVRLVPLPLTSVRLMPMRTTRKMVR